MQHPRTYSSPKSRLGLLRSPVVGDRLELERRRKVRFEKGFEDLRGENTRSASHP